MLEALPRRGFLRRLATLPLIGGGVTLTGQPTAALAIPTAAVPHESVAALLDIEQRLKVVLPQVEAAEAEVGRTRRLANQRKRTSRPLPRALAADASASEQFRAERNYERARKRYTARHKRIDEETGYAAAERVLAGLKQEEGDLFSDVWTVKAVDLPGLKVKARIAAMRGHMDASITYDLLAIAV